MDLINNNPFRIAGILSNATAREIQKQKAKAIAYSKVGKEVDSEYDFSFLFPITRTEDYIEKAFSNIEQNTDKVYHSFYWFLNTNPFDNTAIEYLKNDDENKALEIWEKVTTDKDITAKNFSSFNNLGTLRLLSSSESQIKEGIKNKIDYSGFLF